MTVDALLPLSFLEAVRHVDRPIEDPDAEFVPELRNKRLGLSETVHAQIRRYGEAMRRSQRPAIDEVVALARLIGRRPDAEVVFRAAGEYLAYQAYVTIPSPTRRMVRALPRLLGRALALRQARRLVRRYFAGTLRRAGTTLLLEVPQPVTVDSAPHGLGCTYYETGFRELLHLLLDAEWSVEHVQCAARCEGQCQWKVECRG